MKRYLPIALFLLPGTVFAQDPPPEPEPDLSGLLSEEPDESEVIMVWDERRNKPFDRDTERRITGDELRRRGARDLAEALEFIPEVSVRDVARGGRQIEIRGARKSSVKVFVDGIPLGDPYRGTFDISTIAVTDIVEVRVSASPASPIDGTGGPGGVIEVHTRDAIGGRLVSARTDVNSLPQALASASARTMLGDHFAVRLSANGDVGSRDYDAVLASDQRISLDEHRRAGGGALRLEYRKNARRLAADAGFQSATYVVPPSESETGNANDLRVNVIDRSYDGRAGLVAEDEFGRWRVQARGYGFFTRRKTLFYPDPTLASPDARETVTASSLGGRLLVNRAVGETLELIGSAHLDSDDGTVRTQTGSEVGGRATITAMAVGFKWEQGVVRTDGAAGIAIPLGLGADPWPEGKLSVKLTPARLVATRLVGGYKGRVPTLQERFETGTGNQALGPEKALYGELGVRLLNNDYLELDVAGYVRRLNGFIRVTGGERVNVGQIDVRGMDLRGILMPIWPVRMGGSLSVLDLNSAFGDDAIDRMPERRADGWVDGRYAGRIGGLFRWRYIGKMVDLNMTLPSYHLFDASVWGRLWGDMNAVAGVDNVFDNRYLDRATGVLGVGRVVRVGLQGTWE